MDEERYAFEVTWYDNLAEITRRFMLMYFVRHTGDNEVEMIDLKTNKKFLKRCPYPSIFLKDLYVGGTVTIFSRQLTVAAYSDPFTQRTLGSKQTKSLGIVTSSGLKYLGKAITDAEAAGLNVKSLRMVHLNPEEASQLCSSRPEIYDVFAEPVVVLQLIGEDASQLWSKVAGRLPGGGNSFIGSLNPGEAEREIDLLFGSNAIGMDTVTLDNCTLCVIKPHIVRDGKAGDIISAISQAGFEISAIRSFNLDRVAAEEFLEVYKGVLPEFNAYVEEMSSGTSIALEIRAEDVVNVFRQFVGPHEVEIAKHIRPQTLRARFGKDKVKNAVHCTDLPEDGTLEVDYFFSR